MAFTTRIAFLFATVALVAPLQAQQPVTRARSLATAKLIHINKLSNGLRATAGPLTAEVTALRDDVLRVRVYPNGRPPEDASWAVLPGSRTATISVTPTVDGFSTKFLRIRIDARLQLTVTDLDGNILQQDAEPTRFEGTRFRIAKTKTTDDHYFGLGDKPGPLDRAGMAFTMWNTDSFGYQESTDPIYKSIPFFIDVHKGRAVGVFLDNTFRTTFDFGKQDPYSYSISAPDGPATYYLLYGPTPKQVVETWAWLTGPTPMPPLWTLGFQQSRYTYEPASRLMEIADTLRKDHIPADALYLDIDYQVKNRPFTVDEAKFPNFPGIIKDLAAQNLHLVLITDLHIAHLPNASYAPYDTGTAGDHFVKNPDGSTYIGPVWPGPSVFPDFTQAQTRDWWGTLYQHFTSIGVAGIWNDMNEPAIFETPTKTMPNTVQHRIDEPGFAKRTASHLEIHNVFGMQNSRATYDGLLKLQPNQRPFVLTRASYAGGQRYAATWTGDNSSTWNHLRLSISQIVNLGLSGFALTGADVGGFAGSPSPDLLTKWIELAAFQPIDRDHAAKGTRDHEPWVDGPEQLAIRRRYIEQRYRLMPYLYTVAEEMSRTGLPINRPLFLEFPDATADGHPIDLDAGSEFLVGPSLLIAPNPSPEEVAPYEVHLPPGIWYDFWTSQPTGRRNRLQARDLEQRDNLTGPKPIMVTPTLADLPVYVREGTILPIAPLTQSTMERPNGPLTLRIYTPGAPGEDCHGTLYQDDGISFNFRNGEYLRRNFTCTLSPGNTLTLTLAATEGTYKPWWTELQIQIAGWQPKSKKLTLNGTATNLKQQDNLWITTIHDTATAQVLNFD